jgi:hypothetical protein
MTRNVIGVTDRGACSGCCVPTPGDPVNLK